MTIDSQTLFPVRLLAALGCGLVGGVFLAFSTFIMKALARLPPPQGIAAMQAINVTVVNPWFMAVLFGTAAACLALAIASMLNWQQPGAFYTLIGSLCYLGGAILVTIAGNVPLNDALAAVSPDSADGASLWIRFLANWTFWNHARMLASIAAAVAFILALCDRVPRS
jgi:uncharacterized membrane protein